MATGKGSWQKSLVPELTKYFGDAYKDYDSSAMKVFKKESSDRDSEHRTIVSGLGLAREQASGEAVTYDIMQERWGYRVSHVRYSNGFIITKDLYEDDKAGQVMKMLAPELKKSILDAREIIGMNVLNRAFTNTYTFGDGKELCATDHPTDNSSYTNANELSVGAALSEASLEQAIKDISRFRNQRGLKINVEAKKLVIHKDNIMEAQRILKSDLRVATANNDLNAIKDLNLIPGGVISSIYLTSTSPWFLLTDLNESGNGLVYFEREAMKMADTNDFDTFNMKNIATMRFSFGVFNPLCIFGNVGTGV